MKTQRKDTRADQFSILNSQFPSDGNWESRIENWSALVSFLCVFISIPSTAKEVPGLPQSLRGADLVKPFVDFEGGKISGLKKPLIYIREITHLSFGKC